MENSPLNKLPAELRNRIAELAHHHEGAFKIEADNAGTFKPLSSSKVKNAGALARTCKQLHSDTMPIFYNINAFEIHSSNHRALDIIDTFLDTVGEKNAAAIHEISIISKLGICAFHVDEEDEDSGIVDIRGVLLDLQHDHQDQARTQGLVTGGRTVHLEIQFKVYQGVGDMYSLIYDCHDFEMSLAYSAFLNWARMAKDLGPRLQGSFQMLGQFMLESAFFQELNEVVAPSDKARMKEYMRSRKDEWKAEGIELQELDS